MTKSIPTKIDADHVFWVHRIKENVGRTIHWQPVCSSAWLRLHWYIHILILTFHNTSFFFIITLVFTNFDKFMKARVMKARSYIIVLASFTVPRSKWTHPEAMLTLIRVGLTILWMNIDLSTHTTCILRCCIVKLVECWGLSQVDISKVLVVTTEVYVAYKIRNVSPAGFWPWTSLLRCLPRPWASCRALQN